MTRVIAVLLLACMVGVAFAGDYADVWILLLACVLSYALAIVDEAKRDGS
jgi:hypothetical protein